MRSFFYRHLVLITALIIFSIAFFTRTGALKQYVVPDEPSWVWRSLGFSQALAQGQWADTAQIGHPGVTICHECQLDIWIPATPCPRKARGRARAKARGHDALERRT
jgi:hypothetical protein